MNRCCTPHYRNHSARSRVIGPERRLERSHSRPTTGKPDKSPDQRSLFDSWFAVPPRVRSVAGTVRRPVSFPGMQGCYRPNDRRNVKNRQLGQLLRDRQSSSSLQRRCKRDKLPQPRDGSVRPSETVITLYLTRRYYKHACKRCVMEAPGLLKYRGYTQQRGRVRQVPHS